MTQTLFLRVGNSLPVFSDAETTALHRKAWDEYFGRRRTKVLLLASLISLPYRVLRVAHEAGADIYVLGAAASRGLRWSRFCKKFVATDHVINGEKDQSLAAEINRAIDRFGIDMVLPGDAPAMRSLLAIKELIAAPLFPAPDLEQFDYLNNKWHFTKLCQSLGVKTPASIVAQDAAELKARIDSGEIALPVIAKPINHDGSLGVVKIEAENVAEKIAAIDYGPIIVQEFIDGADIGASVYCDKGEIKAFIAHELKRATYRSIDDRRILGALARIMHHVGGSGVFNFDMRLAPDGSIYYLECNPRFFFKINLSMLAGVNFVRRGLTGVDDPLPAETAGDVRMPKALAEAALLHPWKVAKRDLKMLWHLWSDPVSHLRELLGIDWEYPKAAAATRHFPAPVMEPAGETEELRAPAQLPRAA